MAPIPGSALLALVLALGEPPPEAPVSVLRASLEVDATDLGAQADELAERMRTQGEVVLRSSDVLPGRGPADPMVTVRLSPLEGAVPGFRYSVRASQGEAEIEERSDRCELCTGGEVVEAAGAAMVSVLRVLREYEATPTPKAATGQPRPTAGPDQGAPTSSAPTWGTRGKVGVGLVAGGAVGVAAGLALALRSPTVDAGDPTEQSNTRPAGLSVLFVGTALTVTGVVLLTLDAPTRRSRAARVAPYMAHDGGGVAVTGRF